MEEKRIFKGFLKGCPNSEPPLAPCVLVIRATGSKTTCNRSHHKNNKYGSKPTLIQSHLEIFKIKTTYLTQSVVTTFQNVERQDQIISF